MAATSRRQYSYAPASQKTLPISMPSKAPAYHYPVSRIAMSPPELSDSSTYRSGSRSSGQSYSARSSSYAPSQHSDYDSYNSASAVDVVDMLSDRMNTAFEPIRMDKSLAKQAQT
jgi:biogenesis of lysosome-related organelles complex 1 subunit KXD1